MNIRLAVVRSLVAAFSVLAVENSRSDEPVKVEKPATDPMLGKKLGQVRDDNGLQMKLVWCPPGFVGQKKENPWGLYDMHGNVWEWCRDIYAEKLPGGRDPVVKASEKPEGSDRVLKGGSWRYIFPNWRSGLRYGNQPDIRNALNGFRPALIAVR